jgi:hypothetical protein
VTAEAGLAPRNRPTGITFVDYDHDGDLDLLLTGEPLKPATRPTCSGATTATRPSPSGPIRPASAAAAKRPPPSSPTSTTTAPSISLSQAMAPAPAVYVNPREGKYPTQPLYDEKLPPTEGIAVLDFNKDGWMDIAVTHAGARASRSGAMWKAPRHIGRRFERVDLPLHDALRGWGVTPIDIDNDGWIDLAAIVETASGPQVRVFRNRGDGTLKT